MDLANVAEGQDGVLVRIAVLHDLDAPSQPIDGEDASGEVSACVRVTVDVDHMVVCHVGHETVDRPFNGAHSFQIDGCRFGGRHRRCCNAHLVHDSMFSLFWLTTNYYRFLLYHFKYV